MGLQEIRELAAKLVARLADSPDDDSFQRAARLENMLEEADLESEAPQGPGFVVLPIEAHDRLRATAERAEEAEAKLRACEQHLIAREEEYRAMEARCRQAAATSDRLKAHRAGPEEWSEVGPAERKRAAAEWRLQCDLKRLRDKRAAAEWRLQCDLQRLRDERAAAEWRLQCDLQRPWDERPDPARFPIAAPPGREGDRIEPSTPGPMHVMPRLADPVVHKHLRDLQGEIDALKDRLEESCKQHQGLNARVAVMEQGGAFPDGKFAEFKARLDDQSDRLKALGARLNKLEAQVRPSPIASAVAEFTNSPA